VPAKAKVDFFIQSTTQLEAHRRCDVVRVRYDMQDADMNVMRGARIGPFARLPHDAQDMIVSKKGGAVIDGAKGSNRFPRWELEQIRLMNAAHSCCDEDQDQIIHALEFLNAKSPWAFVKAKVDMDRYDFALQVCLMQGGDQNELML
jgi:hypothetical protein